MKGPDQLTVIIIDDEIASISILETLLSGIEGVSILATAHEADKVLPLYLKHKPDILFLDIQLGGSTGLDVLNQMREMKLNPTVVFITAHDKYALQAIKAGAFDYILKPIDPDDLKKVINKVRDHTTEHSLEKRIIKLEKVVKNHQKLRFNTRSGFVLIHPDEIMYIEAAANYSEIYLSKELHEVVSMNIGTIEEILPEQFIRISRYHIINSTWLVRLSGVNKKCVLKKGDDEISFTIPEKQMPEIKRHFESN